MTEYDIRVTMESGLATPAVEHIATDQFPDADVEVRRDPPETLEVPADALVEVMSFLAHDPALDNPDVDTDIPDHIEAVERAMYHQDRLDYWAREFDPDE